MEKSYLSYTKRTDYIFFLGTSLVLLLIIVVFKYWYRLGFNILFFGYFIFGEMRLATVFYTTIIRIILYPSALINKSLETGIQETEEEYEKIEETKEIFEKESRKKFLLKSKRLVFLYTWFHLCFLTMNAVTIGYIFFQDFTKEKLEKMLFYSLYLPKQYPIHTKALIPLVGEVDLSIPNMKLNLYSAIGAGMVGIAEVILNKKIKRRELMKYLIFFPLGAYFLTYWVPCGFEFALVVFELLTIGIIVIENILKSKVFRVVKTAINPQITSLPPEPKNDKIKKAEVKKLIKEVITEASQEKE